MSSTHADSPLSAAVAPLGMPPMLNTTFLGSADDAAASPSPAHSPTVASANNNNAGLAMSTSAVLHRRRSTLQQPMTAGSATLPSHPEATGGGGTMPLWASGSAATGLVAPLPQYVARHSSGSATHAAAHQAAAAARSLAASCGPAAMHHSYGTPTAGTPHHFLGIHGGSANGTPTPTSGGLSASQQLGGSTRGASRSHPAQDSAGLQSEVRRICSESVERLHASQLTVGQSGGTVLSGFTNSDPAALTFNGGDLSSAADVSPMQASVRATRSPSLAAHESSDDSNSNWPAPAVCRAAAESFRRNSSARMKRGVVHRHREVLAHRSPATSHRSASSSPGAADGSSPRELPSGPGAGTADAGDATNATGLILGDVFGTTTVVNASAGAEIASPHTPGLFNRTVAGSDASGTTPAAVGAAAPTWAVQSSSSSGSAHPM